MTFTEIPLVLVLLFILIVLLILILVYLFFWCLSYLLFLLLVLISVIFIVLGSSLFFVLCSSSSSPCPSLFCFVLLGVGFGPSNTSLISNPSCFQCCFYFSNSWAELFAPALSSKRGPPKFILKKFTSQSSPLKFTPELGPKNAYCASAGPFG